MTVIGITCDNDSFSYAVIKGEPDSPEVIESETHHLKQSEKGKLLDSANHRIDALVNSHRIKRAVFLVVDKTYGKGHNTDTHPVKHQIEGCLIYKFFKENIPCIEYNRTKKLVIALEKKLSESIDCKPAEIEKFIRNKFADACLKVTNKDQREAFAVAVTQL